MNYYAGFTWLRHSKQFERERPTEGKAERERERERGKRPKHRAKGASARDAFGADSFVGFSLVHARTR